MKQWELLDVFNNATTAWEKVPITERDMYKGRNSTYYPRWNTILDLSKCRTKEQAWELLLYTHSAMDDMRAFKSGKNSAAALRAVKVALIDWTASGLIGSGCVINRRFA